MILTTTFIFVLGLFGNMLFVDDARKSQGQGLQQPTSITTSKSTTIWKLAVVILGLDPSWSPINQLPLHRSGSTTKGGATVVGTP